MKLELDLTDRDVRLLSIHGNHNPAGPCLITAQGMRRPVGVVADLGEIETLFGSAIADEVEHNGVAGTHIIVRVLTVSPDGDHLKAVLDELKPSTDTGDAT